MSEPFLGEIRMVGFNFAPQGWATCDGQVLPISQNTALFALLGTLYGGNGVQTFALPDLRGRVPIHQGQGPGLSPYALAQQGGSESVALLVQQMPAHSHDVNASSNGGTSRLPTNNYPAKEAAGVDALYGTTPNVAMNANMIAPNGGGQPHTNIQPYLAVNFIIALQGIFPARN